MTSAKAKTSVWQNIRSYLPGIAVSLVAVGLLVRLVDWQSFGSTMARMDLRLMIPILLLYFAATFTRGLAWQTLLQRKVSLWRATVGLNEGYLVSIIFPFRLGELARAYLIGRATGEGTFFVLSTIVVERAYDMVIASGMLLATLPLALAMDWARPAAFIILALVIGSLFALFWITRSRDKFYTLVERIGGRWKFVTNWLLPKLHEIMDGFGVLNNPVLFLISLGFLLLSWGVAIIECYIVLNAFVPGAPFWWAFFALSVASLGAALPSAPGSLGVYEASGVGALTLIGCPSAAAMSYVLVLHLLHLILAGSWGLLGLTQEGESLTALYNKLRRIKS